MMFVLCSLSVPQCRTTFSTYIPTCDSALKYAFRYLESVVGGGVMGATYAVEVLGVAVSIMIADEVVKAGVLGL